MENLRPRINKCKDISLKLSALGIVLKVFFLRQILKGQNSYADSLAMLATFSGTGLPQVIIVAAPSHDDQSLVRVHIIQVGPSWMDPLVSFLKQGYLPKDKGEAENIRRKAT